MFNLDTINQAREKNKSPEQDSDYNKAVEYLKQFSASEDTALLKKVANLLFKYIKVKKDRVEPYFFLAYIMYLFEKNDIARSLLSQADKIDPKFPHTAELKRMIETGSSSWQNDILKNKLKSGPQTVKAIVSTSSTFFKAINAYKSYK